MKGCTDGDITYDYAISNYYQTPLVQELELTTPSPGDIKCDQVKVEMFAETVAGLMDSLMVQTLLLIHASNSN